MEVFKVRIELAGAAFKNVYENGAEVSRILRKLARDIEDGLCEPDTTAGKLIDINGNVCGYATTVCE